MNVLHLTTHLDTGGITAYILRLVDPLRSHGIETCVLSSGGGWTERFQSKKVPTFELPLRTKSELHPQLYLSLLRIAKLVEEQHIDLLHAHTRVSQVAAFWIQKLTGRPVVTTCHGFFKKRLGRVLLPAWGNCVIAVSPAVAVMLETTFRVPREKIRTVSNGVDLHAMDQILNETDPAKVRENYGFGAGDPVLGIVGRIVPSKGHDYLLKAAEALRREVPNLRVLIVGDGKYRAEVEAMAKTLGLEERVRFTGNVDEAACLLPAMDIFVFPVTGLEGFGLSVIEAMACRLPVVASRIGALDSLIQDGVNGFLLEPQRVDLLAQSILKLLNDKELRQKMGREGRKTVEQRFGIERMAKEIAEIYRSLARIA